MAHEVRTFETTFAGRKLTVQTGKTSELTNGSCWVTYGETVVMANVTASAKPREGVDFFPLSIDYEEKLYAAGRIPGSFLKREGRPTEKATLTSRMIDRPLRPMFPKDMRNDVSVVVTVLATDVDNSPEIAGFIAASIAINISDIPFAGPVAAINVGLIDGELILNPVTKEREVSDLTLTVAGTADKIVMIEAGANEVPNDVMLNAIAKGHEEIKKMVKFIGDIKAESSISANVASGRNAVHKQLCHLIGSLEMYEETMRRHVFIDADILLIHSFSPIESADFVCGIFSIPCMRYADRFAPAGFTSGKAPVFIDCP